MQQVEVVRRFAAPPRAVWEVYTDHAGWENWAGVGRSSLERPGQPERNGVGAVRRFTSAGVGAREEVLEFEPPKRMSYRLLSGALPVRNHLGEVRFEPDGEGTRVVWTCRFESRIPGLGRPLAAFIGYFFRNALDGLARRAFPDA